MTTSQTDVSKIERYLTKYMAKENISVDDLHAALNSIRIASASASANTGASPSANTGTVANESALGSTSARGKKSRASVSARTKATSNMNTSISTNTKPWSFADLATMTQQGYDFDKNSGMAYYVIPEYRKKNIKYAIISSDGKYAALYFNGMSIVKTWIVVNLEDMYNPDTRRVRKFGDFTNYTVTAGAFSYDNKYLILFGTCKIKGVKSEFIALLNTETGERDQWVNPPMHDFVAVSPADPWFALIKSYDQAVTQRPSDVQIWNYVTKEKVSEFKTPYSRMSFTPDGKHLIFYMEHKVMQVNIKGKVMREWFLPKAIKTRSTNLDIDARNRLLITFSPDGAHVAIKEPNYGDAFPLFGGIIVINLKKNNDVTFIQIKKNVKGSELMIPVWHTNHSFWYNEVENKTTMTWYLYDVITKAIVRTVSLPPSIMPPYTSGIVSSQSNAHVYFGKHGLVAAKFVE